MMSWMFVSTYPTGHLMYEMCCGQTLLNDKLMLSTEDYQIIEDTEARKFIQFIFEKIAKKKYKTNQELMKEVSRNIIIWV